MQFLLQWLNDSSLGQAMRETVWLFPLMETLHFVGLCVMIGALLFIDLRLLGFARAIALPDTARFIPLAMAGFVLNLLSGISFFTSDPFSYWENPGFRTKMVLIVVGGLNALWYELRERRAVQVLTADGEAPRSARIVAALSLLTWTAVLALGRLLPYTK